MNREEKISRTVIALEELGEDAKPYVWEGIIYHTPLEFVELVVNSFQKFLIKTGYNRDITEAEFQRAMGICLSVGIMNIFAKVNYKIEEEIQELVMGELKPKGPEEIN